MKKSVWLVSFLLVMSMFLAACSGDEEGTGNAESPSGDGDYVAIVSKGFQHQFWQSVKDGADAAAEEFGVQVTFEGPESESQVDKQMEMLRAALDKNPKAIGFAALDSKAALPLLEEADGKDIPIIAFDSGVDSDIPLSTASTDNKAAAALAADKMAELIGEEGKIAMVVHDQTSVTGVDRRDGFVEQIESAYPNIEIVDIQYGGGDHLKSTDLAKAMMSAHSDLKGIFGTNEGSAIGVVNAVRELNKAGDLTVVGFDSGKAQIDAIKDGLMAGAVTQNPYGIGYETVKAAVAAIAGEEVEEVIDTGFLWYDSENLEDEDVQSAIYE